MGELEAEPGNTDAWVVRLLLDKDNKNQDATDLQKSSVAFFNRLQTARKAAGVAEATTRPVKCTFGPWKAPVRVPTGFRLIKTGPGNPRGRGGYLLLSTACFPGATTPPSKPTPTPGPPNQGFF